jgi:hypothetical protein
LSENLPYNIETELIDAMDIQSDKRSHVRNILIQLYDYTISKIKSLKEKEIQASQNYENTRLRILADVYRQKKVVGLTIIAASRNAAAISQCGCIFVLVEEARKITEGQLLAGIPSTLEHLVMTGDFNQVRPSFEYMLTNHYSFKYFNSRKCRYYKSIKRLVFFIFQLHIQHRMHPNIAQKVKANICSNLQNLVLTHSISTPKFLHLMFVLNYMIFSHKIRKEEV